MRSIREIQAEILQLKAEMKAAGIRRTSMMNRQDAQSSYYNERLFRLEQIELRDAKAKGLK